MTDIDWKISYQTFIQAAERSVEEAAKILKDLVERVHWLDLEKYSQAKKEYTSAAQNHRDAAPKNTGPRPKKASAHIAPIPPEEPGIYEAMFSVERHFCDSNNSRLPEANKIDMTPDKDRPFHWYYWRESLPQGVTPEDCVSAGQRAFEIAAEWATHRGKADEVLQSTGSKNFDEDLPIPSCPATAPSPKREAAKRSTDAGSKKLISPIL